MTCAIMVLKTNICKRKYFSRMMIQWIYTLRKRWHLLNVSKIFVIFLVLCVFYLHSKLYSGRSIKDKSSMVWKHAHCRKGSTFEQI